MFAKILIANRGEIACSDVVEDNTNFPGVHELGGLSAEHTWSFNVSRNGGEAVNFDTCGSDYDTWLRIFNADGQEVAQCDDCGDCGGQAGVTTNLTQAGLEPDGNPHTLLVEGYSDRAGRYESAAHSLQRTLSFPLRRVASGVYFGTDVIKLTLLVHVVSRTPSKREIRIWG